MNANPQPPPTPKVRVIQWQEPYEDSAAAIEPDAKRFADLVEAAEWLIENNALACPEVIGPLRVARAQVAPGEPVVGLLFTISNDDSRCDIWFAVLMDDPVNSGNDDS